MEAAAIREPALESDPAFRDRVGGRWVISWQAYTLGAIVNTFLLAFTGGSIGAEPVNPADVPSWIMVGVLASAAVGVYALAINYTLFRHKRARVIRLRWVVTFHSLVGVIFAAIIVMSARILDLPEPAPLVGFILATAGIGLWWGLTMALLFEARERYHVRRRRLLEIAVQAEERAYRQTESGAALISEIDRQITDELDVTKDYLQSRIDSIDNESLLESAGVLREDWWDIAVSVQESAHGVIRPLSHRLWQSAEKTYPVPRIRAVLLRALKRPSAPSGAIALIVLIGYVRAGMDSLGVALGLVVTVGLAAFVGALFTAAAVLGRSTPRLGVPTFWLAVAIAQIAALAFVLSLGSGSISSTGPDESLEMLASIAAMSVSVFAPVLVASVNALRSDSLSRLQADTDASYARDVARERHLAELTAAHARFLHGTVQTKLMACAGAMQQAAQSGDQQQFESSLKRAIDLLQPSGGRPQVPHSDSLAGSLNRIRAQWDGLVDITILIDDRLNESLARPDAQETAGKVAEIVQEAVANSVRHGDAQTISVEAMQVTSGHIRLRVQDDGIGLAESSAAEGLGTRVMRQASDGRFDRIYPAGGGCEIEAVLRLPNMG